MVKALDLNRETIMEIPAPEETATWKPIRHGYLLEQVTDRLGKAGFEIIEESHALARHRLQYFGRLTVNHPDAAVKDYNLVVGVRNANDKKFPAGLVCGANVIVCSNLMFSGELNFGRRHTLNIIRDLPSMIDEKIGRLKNMYAIQSDRIKALKGIEISNMEAHDLIVRAFRKEATPITRISKVIEQWHEPNHPEFKDRNAWSLFNAFTEVAKEGRVFEVPAMCTTLYDLFGVANTN